MGGTSSVVKLAERRRHSTAAAAAAVTAALVCLFTFAAAWRAEKVLCRSASVCHAVCVCACLPH